MAMRVMGIKAGKGGKVMVIVTWVVGEGMARTTTMAMVTKTKKGGQGRGE